MAVHYHHFHYTVPVMLAPPLFLFILVILHNTNYMVSSNNNLAVVLTFFYKLCLFQCRLHLCAFFSISLGIVWAPWQFCVKHKSELSCQVMSNMNVPHTSSILDHIYFHTDVQHMDKHIFFTKALALYL